MRHQSPDMDRPIKLPLAVHYLFISLCLMLTCLAIQNDLFNSLVGLGLVLLGMPVYWTKHLIEAKLDALLRIGNY